MPSVTAVQIKDIKRKAKALARARDDKSYMQCLDIVCQQDWGLRHFHEAQKLAENSPEQINQQHQQPNQHQSAWTLYLQACQESYFEI